MDVKNITQHTGKLSRKEAKAIAEKAEPVANFVHQFPKLADEYAKLATVEWLFAYSGKVVLNLGAPLVTMPTFESSPGLWMFDDESSGIIFLVWSDGQNKKPWKGTSYEAITTHENESQIAEAFKRLLEYLKSKM